MKLIQMLLGLPLGAALMVSGCGSTDPDAPLTGTWTNTACLGTTTPPPEVARCTIALTFSADLTVELQAEWISEPATATTPRCTTTRRVTGQKWSTEHSEDAEILTVTGVGNATMERTECVNDGDNMEEVSDGISMPSSPMKYQLNNDNLTILSGDLAGSYTR